MADNASYPSIPHRPNFVDIRTTQVHEERFTANESALPTSSWTQIYAAGATLENGVAIKVKSAGSVLNYAQVSVTGLTADGGYQLDSGEELFVPVRQLSNVWVKTGVGTGAGLGVAPTITWKAS